MLREARNLGLAEETYSEKKTRRMEYHTERIVTVKFHPSVHYAIALAGIFFVIYGFLTH